MNNKFENKFEKLLDNKEQPYAADILLPDATIATVPRDDADMTAHFRKMPYLFQLLFKTISKAQINQSWSHNDARGFDNYIHINKKVK